MITNPPKTVCKFGYSPKNSIANIIPKMGCSELIKLAEAAVKCWRLYTNRVCPMAVVTTASRMVEGKKLIILE